MRAIAPSFMVLMLALAGCGGTGSFGLSNPFASDVQDNVAPGPDDLRPQPRPGAPGARTAAAIDTTTQAERDAARASAEASRPAAQAQLGQTLAALGPPAEPGLWLRTGLVESAQPGRIETLSGAALLVELRPSGRPAAAGSEISLAALRALEQPLTALVELRVFTVP